MKDEHDQERFIELVGRIAGLLFVPSSLGLRFSKTPGLFGRKRPEGRGPLLAHDHAARTDRGVYANAA
jgi:hypothetical protein